MSWETRHTWRQAGTAKLWTYQPIREACELGKGSFPELLQTESLAQQVSGSLQEDNWVGDQQLTSSTQHQKVRAQAHMHRGTEEVPERQEEEVINLSNTSLCSRGTKNS